MAAKDVMFIGILIFTLGIGFLIIHFAMSTVVDDIVAQPTINSTPQSVTAFNSIKTTVNRLDYVMFGLFIGLCLALIITGYLIGGNPIFMFIYFIVIGVMVGLSAILSNIWETVSTSTTFTSTLVSFPITNKLLLGLPIYMTVLGFIGIVVMFAKPYFQQQ